jgi:hypothetical protein
VDDLCTAYAVEWPIPPDADSRVVPAWSVLPDEADLLGMPFPTYLEWAGTEAGHAWLTRLRIKWAVEHAARARDLAAARSPDREPSEAEWRAQGWRGGRADPAETTIFDDEGTAA